MKNSIDNRATTLIKRPVGLWMVALVFVLVDYSNGPVIQFPIMYLVPVLAAAWYHGKRQAFALAILLPLIRFSFVLFAWTVPWSLAESMLNGAIRMTMFLVVAYFVARVRDQNEALAMEVKTLSGILPICSFCKKIRTDTGEWVPVESYVRDRSDAEFSHGFCPSCGKEHYGDLMDG